MAGSRPLLAQGSSLMARGLESDKLAPVSAVSIANGAQDLVSDLNRGRPLHAEVLDVVLGASMEAHDGPFDGLRENLVDERASFVAHNESPRGFVPRGLTHVSVTDVIGALPKIPVNPVRPQYSSIGIAS